MKNIPFIKVHPLAFLVVAVFILLGCERQFTDEVEFASFPNTAEIFTDDIIALGNDFYLPYSGSKQTAWSIDSEEGYQSNASMRFDVPNANDPEGNYAGAIFRIEGLGTGRDLSGFDALTFWAKASQAVTIPEIGFGEDFLENKYQTTRRDIQLTTNWVKYIIPIPDPSKLIQERGLLRYAANGIGELGQELGYSFWMDEIKFEKLGTIAQPQPRILDGEDVVSQSVVNGTFDISGLTQTFNTASGSNITVSASSAFFNFKSSDTNIAIVDEFGTVTLINEGTAKITASLRGVLAKGSLTISASAFSPAPIPNRDPANVISLYSNAYSNVGGVLIDANYGGQTTQSSELNIAGDTIISYSNLNYVGMEFQNPTVNATDFNFLHLDIFTNSIATSNLNIEIRDRGSNGMLNTNTFTGAPSEDDKRIVFPITPSSFTPGEWISIDIPLTGDLATQKNNLAALIFSGNIDFLVDNIYLYK